MRDLGYDTTRAPQFHVRLAPRSPDDSCGGMRNYPCLFLLLAFAGCPSAKAPQAAATAPNPVVDAFAADVRAAIDPNTAACDDFYEYACGSWLANTELPGDRTSYTRSFSVIDERNDELIKEILEGALASAGADADMQKLGTFYQTCMNVEAIDARGADPIAPTLGRIAKLKSRAAIFEEAGRLSAEGYDTLFSGFASADAEDPDLNVLHLYQGGLGLPDKSYFQDEARAELVQAYEAHIVAQLMNVGDSEKTAAAKAARIIDFERKMAELHWDRADLRDSDKTNNRLDREGLAELTPGLPWDRHLAAAGVPDLQAINVATPSVFDELDELFNGTPVRTLRDYLSWHVISGAAPSLSTTLADESFAFYGQKLRGQATQRERWKRCVESVDEHLGHLVGRAYIARAFPGESKDLALDLVARVGKAFEGRLPELEWMDDATRAAAVDKAETVVSKIGYPDEGAWRTYEFDVVVDDHFGNVSRARKHEVNHQLSKVDKPVDRSEWFMNPHMVNAYYNPSANEIAFPAGILQPPFFHAGWPKAANYGAIGTVIGHELTHGFDDEGRKFDARGSLNEWWADDVVADFEERAECVVDAYNGYTIDGTPVNGELTLGENIADLGGARLSYRAYKAWVAEHGAEPDVRGLSGDQLFFVAMAQSWCTLRTPERAQMLLSVDPHSPPRYRVNGTMAQMPEFAEAFGCETGSSMVPENACEVW